MASEVQTTQLKTVDTSKTIVTRNGQFITQTALLRYLALKRDEEALAKEREALKAEIVAAYKDGRRAEPGAGNLSVTVTDRETVRPEWKKYCAEFVNKLNIDWDSFEANVRRNTTPSKTVEVKIG